jgi:hypothetical protein
MRDYPSNLFDTSNWTILVVLPLSLFLDGISLLWQISLLFSVFLLYHAVLFLSDCLGLHHHQFSQCSEWNGNFIFYLNSMIKYHLPSQLFRIFSHGLLKRKKNVFYPHFTFCNLDFSGNTFCVPIANNFFFLNL